MSDKSDFSDSSSVSSDDDILESEQNKIAKKNHFLLGIFIFITKVKYKIYLYYILNKICKNFSESCKDEIKQIIIASQKKKI